VLRTLKFLENFDKAGFGGNKASILFFNTWTELIILIDITYFLVSIHILVLLALGI